MKIQFFSLLIYFFFNNHLYSQILTLKQSWDSNQGIESGFPRLPTGGYPDYHASGIALVDPNIQFTTVGPKFFNTDGTNFNQLFNGPDTLGTNPAGEFPNDRYSNGSFDSQSEADVFRNVALALFTSSTSAKIIVYDRSTQLSEAQINSPKITVPTTIPPNSVLGSGGPSGMIDIAIGNVDDVPTVYRWDEALNLFAHGQLVGPVGYDFVFLNLPTTPTPIKSSTNKLDTPTSTLGHVMYKADDGVNGQELWITDGTVSGTKMVKDINTTGSSYPSNLTPMNNKLYFAASGSVGQNQELWVSDGTLLGTDLVKNINPNGADNVNGMININSMLYFSANGGSPNWTELWKSDGTAEGTVMIKNINETAFDVQNIGGFTLFNGLIYFKANDVIHGSELWVTDGTEGGTHLVKNINNTGDGSAGSNLILPGLPYGNVFYFYANDGVHGSEIWVSDGTREGTQLAYDLFPGSASSNTWTGWGKIAGSNLYASADDGVIGNELFVFENLPTDVPMTSCSLKVFLEGPYNSGSMATNLTTDIPLRQPFNNSEGNYYGDETISNTFAATHNIVDWALVELRSGASASEATTIVSQKAVLVNSNGDLVDLDGSLDIDFKWVDAGDYYVSVYHRNHLAVLSSGTVTLTN